MNTTDPYNQTTSQEKSKPRKVIEDCDSSADSTPAQSPQWYSRRLSSDGEGNLSGQMQTLKELDPVLDHLSTMIVNYTPPDVVPGSRPGTAVSSTPSLPTPSTERPNPTIPVAPNTTWGETKVVGGTVGVVKLSQGFSETDLTQQWDSWNSAKKVKPLVSVVSAFERASLHKDTERAVPFKTCPRQEVDAMEVKQITAGLSSVDYKHAVSEKDPKEILLWITRFKSTLTADWKSFLEFFINEHFRTHTKCSRVFSEMDMEMLTSVKEVYETAVKTKIRVPFPRTPENFWKHLRAIEQTCATVSYLWDLLDPPVLQGFMNQTDSARLLEEAKEGVFFFRFSVSTPDKIVLVLKRAKSDDGNTPAGVVQVTLDPSPAATLVDFLKVRANTCTHVFPNAQGVSMDCLRLCAMLLEQTKSGYVGLDIQADQI